MKKNIIILFSTILIVSCTKQWLNVNTDPNSPANVTINLVLPAAELSVASVINTDYNIAGGIWVQYWTQSTGSSQYANYDNYNITSSTLDFDFQQLYTYGLNDLEWIKKTALQQQDSRDYLIATAVQCYGFQMLADLYDQIPFSQAFKGAQNIHPHYESGKNIYDSLIVRLNYAVSMLNNAMKNPATATLYSIAEPADLIFSGNVQSWLQFVNTLKLKIYLREIYANPLLDSINNLLNQPVGFLTSDAAITFFTNNPSRDNPLYELDIRNSSYTGNIKASNTIISWLKPSVSPPLSTDTRVSYLFNTNTNGQIEGMPQGSYTDPTWLINPSNISGPNIQATDPAYLFCQAEAYFLKAEAELRLGVGSQATDYDNGIAASFSRLGISTSIASNFYKTGGRYAFPTTGFSDDLKAIIVQKWAALANINGMEAYLEFLRTTYPSRNNSVYGYPDLVNPANSVLPPGQYPKRLLFPLSEIQTNPNTPSVVSNPITKPVWWNVNN